MKKYSHIILLGILCITLLIFSEKGMEVVRRVIGYNKLMNDSKVIALDPGHGGRDPGKVGVNQILEKDINLAIGLKVKTFLEQKGYRVIITRTEDVGLYEETDSNKKTADLRKRVEIIESNAPILAVSIHQNSFQQAKYRGAQVFYHEKSSNGKKLAQTLQKQLKETLKDGNKREAKSNGEYYMLRKVSCPLTIVECGFLSNEEEARLLADERYQEKIAWAIHMGIVQYINQR